MDILKVFGGHIRKMRKERGLTQEGLAQKCGMYTPYIGEIERGEKNPTLISLHKLAGGLSISLAELLSVPELEKKDQGRIMAMVSEADPKKQKKILNAIRLMVD